MFVVIGSLAGAGAEVLPYLGSKPLPHQGFCPHHWPGVRVMQERSATVDRLREGPLLKKIIKRFCGSTAWLLDFGCDATWLDFLLPIFEAMHKTYFDQSADPRLGVEEFYAALSATADTQT